MYRTLTERKKEAKTYNTTDFGEGIFSMEAINQVNDEGNSHGFPAAKKLAKEIVDASKARETNKRKAIAMIELSKGLKNLIHGLTNFSLAHQGLGVIK